MMAARDELIQLRELKKKKRALERQIASLRLTAQTAEQSFTDGRTVRRLAGHGDKIGEIVAKIVDLEKELQEQISLITDIETKASRTIRKLTRPIYQAILTDRFINCKTVEQVAQAHHYSIRRITTLSAEALEEYERFAS